MPSEMLEKFKCNSFNYVLIINKKFIKSLINTFLEIKFKKKIKCTGKVFFIIIELIL